MDILISSNLERLLWLVAGPEKCRGYMQALSENGIYTVEPEVLSAIQEEFAAYFCDEALTAKTVKEYFETYKYLSDTHTAVALSAAKQYARSLDEKRTVLVASTASPYKFSPAVLGALGKEVPEDGFDALRALQKVSSVPAPERLANLETQEDRFAAVVNASEMKDAVLVFAEM